MEQLVAVVHGHVQGVGFRWWTKCRALEAGVAGHARNLPDGRVEVVAQGERAALERLLADLRGAAAPGRVDTVTTRWGEATGAVTGFVER